MRLNPPETKAFLSIDCVDMPRPRLSRNTSASSPGRSQHTLQPGMEVWGAHISRIACHEVARENILARFASTCLALVPTSATLTENRGFRVASAMVSAVDVLPTPGGPANQESQNMPIFNR